MASDDSDKSEEPTAKRKGEAREQGQIGRSADFNSAVMLIAGVLALYWFGGRFTGLAMEFYRNVWNRIPTFQPGDVDTMALLAWTLQSVVELIWPILLVLLVAGLVVGYSQVGMIWTWKPLQPNFSKVFSLNNLKNLVGVMAWVEALKGVFKVVLIALVGWSVFMDNYEALVSAMGMEPLVAAMLTVKICAILIIKVAIIMLLLGLLDLWWQKHRTHEKLKMTKQEVKDEMKNMIGDPKVIAQRRRAMVEMHRRFMSREVPKATVVITNPTHYSIALRYNRGEDSVPVVLAKGVDRMALRIREIAKEHNVPIVENRPLARAMYDLVEPGQEVPAQFFSAVAEVLAFVFSVGERRSA